MGLKTHGPGKMSSERVPAWASVARRGFHKACAKFGVPDVDMFQTVDLWEFKNINNVTKTIYAIGRTCYKHPEFQGPFLGPRPSEENRREWTEEQLRAGEMVIGLQAGTNKGATQAGQSFGATRKILLGK
ncbi:Muscle-specific protein 20 [Homalodisca vitripennis]|nr:Muscle-specific protein 20 [Homalodisca vitripennis]